MVIFKLLSCKHAKVIKTHTEVNNHQRACRDSRDTSGAFLKNLVFFYVLAWTLPFYFRSFQEWIFFYLLPLNQLLMCQDTLKHY